MAERGPNRARNENLKTEVSFSNRGAELELGKLVRLPYIRKISNNPSSSNSHSHNHPGHNHHNHNSQNNPLERRSLENRETRLMRNSNKELHLLQHTYLNTLTLQEIELCRDSSAEKDVLPKINPHQLLMLREKSLEALEPSLANREKKSLTKMDFTDKVRDSEKIKDYRLGPLVGKGTYSVVRAGKNREGRRVAIKTYLRTSLSNEDRRKNLENEISVLSSL